MWKKGQSGNPSGRPKIDREVAALARAHTAASIRTLKEIMLSKRSPAAARVACANSLLDRGYGRPPQSMEIGVNRKPLEELTDIDLMAIAAGVDVDVPADDDVPSDDVTTH